MNSSDPALARRGPTAVPPLPRWQRLTLYATVIVLVATGIGWLLTASPPDEPGSPTARVFAAWCLRLHGIAAYGVLIAVGSMLPVHVRQGWVRHRNRRSGSALVALMVALAVSGLWLYYGPESGRDTVSTAHWVIGIGLPVGLLLHRAWGLRGRQG